MGWLDALLGRTRLPKARPEGLFALTTAQLALKTELGWEPAGRAALCLKPITTGAFRQLDEELKDLVRAAAGETGTEIQVETDSSRYRWIVLPDLQLDDLVALIHLAAQELQSHGYGPQLLAAVFRFTTPDRPAAYLIYNYKRGAFYPFVPTGSGKDRASDLEFQFQAAMEKEMPIEPDVTRWYPMWGMPL